MNLYDDNGRKAWKEAFRPLALGAKRGGVTVAVSIYNAVGEKLGKRRGQLFIVSCIRLAD